MSGLVGYESSDDEVEVEVEMEDEANQPSEPLPIKEPLLQAVKEKAVGSKSTTRRESSSSQPQTTSIAPPTQSDVPIGPALPPTESQNYPSEGLEETPLDASSNRALLHDLTLPTVPNFDIPPSPPGSPPAGTTKKFDQFLALKKTGTHFNSKLENSAAMRNPVLMDKLLTFAGMPNGDASQYETTLSIDLWDPAAYPENAFRGPLRKARDKLAKEKEVAKTAGGRTKVDFVPAINANGVGSKSAPARGGLSNPKAER